MSVVACGALVWRRDHVGALEVLVVHRPHYDDWSFAKGKLDPGESLQECAQREVFEETGYSVELGSALPDVFYRDRKDRAKVVHYWAATVVAGSFVANDEVDEIRWVTPRAAVGLLSYARDAELLEDLGKALL
jgi:8-oxo-dGTP pyrophosphatase MutT (NUDIX family)